MYVLKVTFSKKFVFSLNLFTKCWNSCCIVVMRGPTASWYECQFQLSHGGTLETLIIIARENFDYYCQGEDSEEISPIPALSYQGDKPIPALSYQGDKPTMGLWRNKSRPLQLPWSRDADTYISIFVQLNLKLLPNHIIRS